MTDSSSTTTSTTSPRVAVFGSANTIDRLEADVRAAAEMGFTQYWSPQIFDLDVLTAFAVIGSRVPGIRLGTAVVPTYPRHPMALAQQALTVNQATGGRLDLGIGLSHKPVVEGMWGLPFDRPVKHMSDYLKILGPLLAEQRVSHGGELVTGRGEIGLRADAPPVFVAALGEQMLRLAGRYADGTVTWMTGPATIEQLTAPTINGAAEAAERPAPQVIAALPVCVTDDVAAARERAATEYAIYGQLPSYRAMLDREGMDGPADLAAIGSAEQVADALGRFLDAGATTVVANAFGSPDEIAGAREAAATLL